MSKNNDEICLPCDYAVAIGNYLRVCKKVDGKKECKLLMDKVVTEKITPQELFKTVRKKVKKGSKEEKLLDDIDVFIKQEEANAKKAKRKKKR